MTTTKDTSSEDIVAKVGGTGAKDSAKVSADKAAKPKVATVRKPRVAKVATVVSADSASAQATKTEAVKSDLAGIVHAAEKVTEKAEVAAVAPKTTLRLKKFYYAVGRRKSAICQVKLMPVKGEMTVNKIELTKYFPTIELQAEAMSPLVATNQAGSVSFMAKITGGGKRGQSDSLRHALARALVDMDPAYRLVIKKLGYLTRDPRVKERKKPGLKRARRAPQWQKR